MAICKCGCGQEIEFKPHHKYKPPQYIKGHHIKSEKFYEGRKKLRTEPPPDQIPTGYCECGCGQKTPICTNTRAKFGEYNGYPLRYIHGHHPRGKRAGGWKGGRKKHNGYWVVYMPEHHLANKGGYVPEHRLIWEKANGRELTPDQHIHHIDGNIENNDPANLVALTKKEHSNIHKKCDKTNSKRSKAQKKYYSDPEIRKAHSERMKLWWKQRREQKL